MLRREPMLMTLDEFMRLHDWALINGIGRPNQHLDPAKGYFPVARVNPDDPPVEWLTFRDMFMRTTGKRMRQLGAKDEEVEERWKKYIKGLRDR